MSTNRKLLSGFAAAAAVYLIASVVTITATGHRFRPLYEGIGPSAPYRWVHPPAAFKSTNITPVAVTQTLQLTSAGSEQSGAATIDGQLVLSLPAGAIPPARSNQSVDLTITPVDPVKLAPLPPGLYSDGNAYRITAVYQPTKTAIPAAAKPIDAVLRTPVSSAALLASTDGKSWVRVADQHIPTQAAVATTFTNFGYLLAAANVPVVTGSSSSSTNIVLLAGLGLAAIAAVTVSLLWRADRRRRPRRPKRDRRG